MIEWMQTHRKWLVITIWIATIAFIGAGFVGWGQFQFGHKQSVVAKIKDTEVTIKDVQNEYNLLFQQFNQQLGGKLDEATAKKLGLDKMAIQKAIQNGILRQYAKDLGLYVTDKELADYIIKLFGSTKNYKIYLKNTGQTAEEFEKTLRKDLLVQKLINLLHLKPTKNEILSVASALYNADNLNVKILKKSDLEVDLSEKEIKEYYEKHKNEFLGDKKYRIAYVKIPLDVEVSVKELKSFYEKNKLNYKNSNGEILPFEKVVQQVKKDYAIKKLKKEAILAYKDLKENKNFKIRLVTFNNDLIPKNKMDLLIKNGYLKPFVYNDYYISAKLLEEINPTPISFEEAKAQVMEILLNKKATKKLIEMSKEEINNFNGSSIGFITKFDVNKIPSLSPQQAVIFLQKVFTSTKSKDFVLIPENNPEVSVLYKINKQKLLYKKEYEKAKNQVINLTEALLNKELINDLIDKLQQEYSIKVYIK